MFINPKTDFAFKKIFGSEESKGILISFLNALLYEGEAVIQDLRILNPYVAPRVKGLKDSYLDVRAQFHDGTDVIIEMQVLNYEGFEKRILYNAAKTYSTQLKKGDEHHLLNPVIALTITDFRMFDWSEEIISRFILKEKNQLMDYPIHDLELVFVELPKFTKPLEDLKTLTDKWIFFLRSARDLEVVPEVMDEVPELHQAFSLANEAILSPEERDDLIQKEMFLNDMKTGIQRTAEKLAAKAAAKAAAEGEAKGRAIGEAKGQALGEARGRELGAKETRLAIARSLLDILDLETISYRTGLSLDELRPLTMTDPLEDPNLEEQ